MKKSRRGKYYEYERKILRFLSKQNDDVAAWRIKRATNIPRSSMYDVLGKLRYFGYINWIGESQDAISMIWISPRGKRYLKHITNS